jgi:hypothetical protein
MASTLEKHSEQQLTELSVLIHADDFEEAWKDPRVREVVQEAEAFVREFERKGRNL